MFHHFQHLLTCLGLNLVTAQENSGNGCLGYLCLSGNIVNIHNICLCTLLFYNCPNYLNDSSFLLYKKNSLFTNRRISEPISKQAKIKKVNIKGQLKIKVNIITFLITQKSKNKSFSIILKLYIFILYIIFCSQHLIW